MFRYLLSWWLLLVVCTAWGQAPADLANPAKPAPKRQLQAVRIGTAPKLDGLLDEAVWQTAPIATKFYELEPTPGREEKHPTEVRVL